MHREKESVSRRQFLKEGAAAVAATGTLTILGAARAQEPRLLKAGLVGCGGRGLGAAVDCMKSSPNVKITAVADLFKDRAEHGKTDLEKRGAEIPPQNVFDGFDAFKKILGTDIDIVLLCTPPHFRPEHLEAAVEAKKHVFMEKPAAVDPVGVRRIIACGEKAKPLGLSIVAGTQRRHQAGYVACQKEVQEGAIGKVLSARAYWCGGGGGGRPRDPKEMDQVAWQIRNWYSVRWLSGDHIVEQHVHNLDVINWFLGNHPVAAMGMGSRLRRKTGDNYDNFAVDFEYPDGIHCLSMCRQISGCAEDVSEFVQGEKGASNCGGDIWGAKSWSYKGPSRNPYVEEHADLVESIRSGKPINEARNVAWATMAAVMGRISAYTGQRVTWDDAMKSDLRLGPTVYELGTYPLEEIPIPGKA